MNTDKIVNLPGPMGHDIGYGTVCGLGEHGYVVHGSSGIQIASVAFSCLVKPMEGDKVIYSREPGGRQCYILFILERTTRLDTVVSFPGDVLLEAGNGRVMLAGSNGVDLTTAGGINMLAADLNVSAQQGQLSIQDLHATGESFTGTVKKTRFFSDTLESVAKHVTQRTKTCFRFVEDIDQVSAGQMISKVKNLFSVRARQSAITASGDVKVDGKRIHIG